MSTRYIELNDEKLKELVVRKGEIVDKGREHYQNMATLHEAGNAIAVERNEVVAEILELTGEALKGVEMAEFEMASTTDIKNGQLRVSIIDRLAMAKANMRNEVVNAKRKEEGKLTEAEIVEEKQAKVLEAIQQIPQEELTDKLEAIIKVLE